MQRLRQQLERAHDLQPVAHLAAVPAVLDQVEEVPALELQRLVVRDLRTEDVARTRAPLARRARGGPALPRTPCSPGGAPGSPFPAARIAGGFSTKPCLPASRACFASG